MFQTSTYADRRNRLRTLLPSGVVLLLGNDESPMNYLDNAFPFRQDSTFLYYFGTDIPGLVGILDLDERKDSLFGDDFTIDDIVWRGPQPTIAERGLQAGVHRTGGIGEARDFIEKARQKGRTVHILPPYRADHQIRLFDWLGFDPRRTAEAASVDLIRAVVSQRSMKTGEEIAEIDKAVALSADMHLAAMRCIRPGMTEAQVMAVVHETALAAGGDLAFPIIATRNGQTLHNHHYGNRLEDGRMFLLDAGAEVESHYGGDLSSTFPIGRKFTERQKDVYNVALASHEQAVSLLKTGRKFKEIHLEACAVIAGGLKDLGLMKGSPEEAVREGAHAMFFPCGLGHMMGLDVHDMENLGEVYVGYEGGPKSAQFGLKSLRLARELRPGFVLTIEPGIYFIPELIDQWRGEKKFMDFLNYDKLNQYKDFGGCRNEENYVITETGAKLLGKPLPKTVEGVEALRAASR
ncbi:MAG: aminopeptidase P family protein [Candidatus Aminicenantales bacterium]|jgi:Xaa-Pro aminopeptidase